MQDKMIDQTVKPIEGYFILEQFDKDGNLIDKFEDKNMIMLNSKITMRDGMQGMETGSIDGDPSTRGYPFINTFVLGTEGHNPGNILEPRNFTYQRDHLFSVDNTNGKTYPITFDPLAAQGVPGSNIIDEGYDPDLPGSKNDDSTVSIFSSTETENEAITYIFYIPVGNANDSGQAIAYTEAALYSNVGQDIPQLGLNPGDPLIINNYGTIFAMRTFPGKIKDVTSSLRITWKIVF
jgi:hypothetical protein